MGLGRAILGCQPFAFDVVILSASEKKELDHAVQTIARLLRHRRIVCLTETMSNNFGNPLLPATPFQERKGIEGQPEQRYRAAEQAFDRLLAHGVDLDWGEVKLWMRLDTQADIRCLVRPETRFMSLDKHRQTWHRARPAATVPENPAHTLLACSRRAKAVVGRRA